MIQGGGGSFLGAKSIHMLSVTTGVIIPTFSRSRGGSNPFLGEGAKFISRLREIRTDLGKISIKKNRIFFNGIFHGGEGVVTPYSIPGNML